MSIKEKPGSAVNPVEIEYGKTKSAPWILVEVSMGGPCLHGAAETPGYPEHGVAKHAVCALKRNICHFVRRGMLHFDAREVVFATVASVSVETEYRETVFVRGFCRDWVTDSPRLAAYLDPRYRKTMLRRRRQRSRALALRFFSRRRRAPMAKLTRTLPRRIMDTTAMRASGLERASM